VGVKEDVAKLRVRIGHDLPKERGGRLTIDEKV